MPDYEIIKETPIYDGLIFKVSQRVVRLPNGKEAKRDILEMSGASAILPVLPDGRILFVNQYREAAEKMILEIPAGKLDRGENPEDGAIRELEEETGYQAPSLQFMFSFYPAAAYNTEQIYVYLAEDLRPGVMKPDEDEFLTQEALDLETALAMIDDGRISDAKTVAALLFYERMRRASCAGH